MNAKKAEVPRPQEADAMPPLSTTEACGPNLEYDPEYVMLMAKATPRAEAQYGHFVDNPAPPEWREIERDCRRLLLRSRDINLLVLLLRCRTRIAQATGLRDELGQLVTALTRYPEAIHPQAVIEGESDLTVRANALAVLSAPEGFLSDVRDIVLSSNSALRLQVRDVERAFAIPRHADALSVESVQQQIRHLRGSDNGNLAALVEAAQLSLQLQQWSVAHLGELAPDLSKLTRLLGLFIRGELLLPAVPGAHVLTALSPAADEMPSESTRPAVAPTLPVVQQHLSGAPTAGREAALQAMISARAWFEQSEPSSPVAVLLRQAERLVGKRFAQVVQCIPLELLERWEQENSAPQ